MKTTIKLWVIAQDADEAAYLASEHRCCYWKLESADSVLATRAHACEKPIEQYPFKVYPVTLTIEVGEPAEKGGET